MSRAFMKPFVAVVVFGSISIIGSVVLSSSVSADQPQRGPDPSFIQVGPNAPSGWPNRPKATSYVVSNDGGATDIRSTYIKVYATTPTISLKLYSKDMCVGSPRFGSSNSFDQVMGSWYPSPPSSAIGKSTTSFQISRSTASGDQPLGATIKGNWSRSSTCRSAPTTRNLTGASRDASTGLYMYRVRALVDSSSSYARNFVNLFWLRADVASGQSAYVTQDTRSGSAQNFGYQLSSPIPSQGNNPPANPRPGSSAYVYYRTTIPFGSDCTVGSGGRTSTMSFYDLDSGNSTVQPRLPLEIRLEKSNGSAVSLSRGSGSQGSLTSIGGGWYRISGGNQQTINANFRAERDAKYRLTLRNVYYNNTLQFRIPYESVFYYRDCQDARLTGDTSQPTTVLTPGQSASWRHTVTNHGPGAAAEVIAEIRQRIYGRNGNQESDTVISPRLVNNRSLANGASASRTETYEAKPGDVGKRICQRVTWRSLNAGNGQTTETCTIVGKQPKLQLWGGDLRAGDNVNTSTSAISGRTYGSWGEYGAFIRGRNNANRFGSGASLAEGASSLGSRRGNEFTFANTGITGNYGQYGAFTAQNSILATYMGNLNVGATGTVSGTVDLGSRASGRYTASGNVTLRGSVGAGRTIIIDARGRTVTIGGNITYSGSPYNNVGQLPQVVILADRININDSVTNVDAWLVAANVFNTCANRTNVSISICDDKLKVNGPVASDDAVFKRTAGSDDTDHADDPAEVLNLRADTYLWQYSQARRSATPLTVKVTELPPRY